MSVNNRSSIVSFALKTLVGAVASAVLISANAAGLGKLTVLSALGQPLRAEIELSAVTPEEASGLSVRLASPDAFRTANIDFNPALSALRFDVEQRNGRRVIRVSSNQPLNEPFVDLLLELNWNGGRMVREYTFLLDPPEMRSANSPQVAAPVDLGPTRTPTTTTTTTATAAGAIATATGNTAPAPAAASSPAAKPAAKAAAEEVTVKRGDTLSGIASQLKPGDVSLDVMLVALYRANPEAFSGNNMNRLKSGQILAVPDAGAIREAGTDADAQARARGVVVAHARDFNAYRARLAGQVANSAPSRDAGTGQNSSGKITAKVEEQANAVNAARDKLTLSKATADKPGEGKTGAATEDKIARQKQVDDASSRVKELEKNVNDLEKLMEVKSTSPATAPAAASAASAAIAGAAPAPAAAAPAPAKMAPVIPPRKLEEPGMFEKLLANSQMVGLLIAALLVAVVAALAVIAARRRRKFVVPRDESGPDGLAAAPAWDPVPTAAAAGLAGAAAGARGEAVEPVVGDDNNVFRSHFGPSDFAPSASQLDNNEVDPVAEADVYIAYGRDTQAEEILKEALRNHPERHAVRLKLLEIYANRQDARTFESQASELYSLTRGQGDEWTQAARLGRELEPGNPLYASVTADDASGNSGNGGSSGADGFGVAPLAATAGVAAAATAAAATAAAATAAAAYAAYDRDDRDDLAGQDGLRDQGDADTGAPARDAAPAADDGSYNDDLETALPQAADAAVSPASVAAQAHRDDFGLGDLDFAAPPAADPYARDPLAPLTADTAPFLQDDSFNLSYDTPAPAPAPAPASEPAPEQDSAYDPSMDFSLDLPAEPSAPATPASAADASAEATRVPLDFDAADFTIPDVPALAVPPADAAPTPAPVAESVTDPVAAAAVGPADETADEAVDQPAVEAEDQPADDAADQPVDAPAYDPADAPAYDPADDLADEPANEPADAAVSGPAKTPYTAPAASNQQGAPEFDLSGIDFDLSKQPEPEAAAAATAAEADRAETGRAEAARPETGRPEPMSALQMEMDTKLDLAIAYQEIGDKEGARELLDEVLRGGSDEQVAKANAMKAQLA